MRKVFLLATVLLAAQSTQAREINGNLDMSVSTERGDVYLTFVNKKLDTPVTLTGIELVLPQDRGHDSKKLPLISNATPIASSTRLKLGTVEKLASAYHPSASPAQIASASPSFSDYQQAPPCGNCSYASQGIALNITFVYASGVRQNVLTQVFMQTTASPGSSAALP